MSDRPKAFAGLAFSVWLTFGWADDGDHGTSTFWLGPMGFVFVKPDHLED